MQNRDKGYIYLPKKVKDSIQAVFVSFKGKIQLIIIAKNCNKMQKTVIK